MTAARVWFGVAVVMYVLLLVVGWATLPDRVPVHFGLTGSADRYEGRGTAVLVLAAIGLGTAALFAALAAVIPRTPLNWVDVPHKNHWTATPEREHRLRRMMAEDMYLYGALTLTLLSGVLALILTVADDPQPRFGPAGWSLISAFTLATLGYAWYCHRQRYRPELP
jgi:uncharacterized membrane protein